MSNMPKVNPFSLGDKDLSTCIIASHNPKSKIYNVDHLYNKLLNFIEDAAKSSHNINKLLELKYEESKVLHGNNFVPTFPTLKDISSQMTKKCSDAYIAHEIIMWILEKLHEYNWATKGVIVLAAFALDYGEPWDVSKMAPTRTNSLEIHISSGEGMERLSNVIDYQNLVSLAMQLIKIVINMDKLIVKNNELQGTAQDELYQVPRDIYTYWAIFALLASASQMPLDLKSQLDQRIGTILTDFSGQWETQIAKVEDYLRLLNVFRNPSGNLQLLAALIYPKGTSFPEIYDGTIGRLVEPDVLKTKYLLCFISGVGPRNMESSLQALSRTHESFTQDPKKSNYQILWVPVEDEWDQNETITRYFNLRSLMPWYIVPNVKPIEGYRLLKELWKYEGDPIVVLVDPQGKVLNLLTLTMIKMWGESIAFPFTEERQDQLDEQFGWLWRLLQDADPHMLDRFTNDRNIFVYGGTNDIQVENFGGLVEKIKKVSTVEIEHFNLGEKPEISEKFWHSLTTNLQERILNRKRVDDPALLEMEMLLIMKEEKAWVLFMKGFKLLVVDYDTLIYDTLEEFEKWKESARSQGFHNAFKEYYQMKRSQEIDRHSYHFELQNLPFAPQDVICPDPNCRLKMKVKSIQYMCNHEKLNQHLKDRSKKKDDETALQL